MFMLKIETGAKTWPETKMYKNEIYVTYMLNELNPSISSDSRNIVMIACKFEMFDNAVKYKTYFYKSCYSRIRNRLPDINRHSMTIFFSGNSIQENFLDSI